MTIAAIIGKAQTSEISNGGHLEWTVFERYTRASLFRRSTLTRKFDLYPGISKGRKCSIAHCRTWADVEAAFDPPVCLNRHRA